MFIAAAMVTIAVGLFSRHVTWVPAWVGDLLWATMVYFLISVLMPHAARWRRGVGALAFSYLVEVSQLFHRPWLDHIRDSAAGHLVLGSTFVWTDLVAYTAGVALGIAATTPRRTRAVSPTATASDRSP